MEAKVLATKSQIEEFKESFIWKDIRRELVIWKRMAKNEYSQVVGEAVNEKSDSGLLLHLGSIYGREATIDYLIALPDVFLQILEEKENDT
jgi:hypothetical protein